MQTEFTNTIDAELERAQSCLRSQPGTSVQICQDCLNNPECTNEQRIRLLLTIARAHIHLGKFSAGSPFAEEALKLAREYGYRRLEGLALNELGVYHFLSNNTEAALNAYAQAEDLLKQYGTSLDLGRVYVNVGNVFHRRKQYIEAVESYQRTLNILNDQDDTLLRAKVLSNVASLYQYVLYDFDTAADYTSKAIELYRQLGDDDGLAKALHNYGQHLRAINKPLESIPYLKEALDLRVEFSEPMDLALNLSALAASYAETNQIDESEKIMDLADRYVKQGRLSDVEAPFLLITKGAMLARKGLLKEATDIFKNLRPWLEENDLAEYEVAVLREEALYHAEAKNFEEATKSLIRLLHLYDQQAQIRAETRLLHTKRLIEAERARSREEIERLRNSELAEAVQRLERTQRENEEYMAFLAHELKNPLSTIRSVTAMLVGNTSLSLPDRMSFEREIHAIATRMTDLVTKMLESARSRLKEPVGIINVMTPITYILNDLAYRAKQKDVQLHWSISHTTIEVRTDEQTLITIVDNLVGNAIKFSPTNGEVQCTFTVQPTQERGDVLLISVADNGPGLSEADKFNLFQPFLPLSAKPTGSEVSTGLGLHLVRRSVEQLNGRIWCESEKGVGTTFFVELPIVSAS